MIAFDLHNYDTDKSSAYLANYLREFGDRVDQPVTLLELGVRRGGSLLMWRDLLPHATIAGLDLNPVDLVDPTGRVHVYQGFQQDREVLDRIAADVAPEGFDVIIDDASHVGVYTEAAFWHLFARHLKPGGIYVIEDWSCAYWPQWTDGHRYTGTAAFRAAPEMAPPTEAPRTSWSEAVSRSVRARARPLVQRLSPSTRQRLERVYMRTEGAMMKTRFHSHDYGLAGFVKQLVDACAVDVIKSGAGAAGETSEGSIDRVHVLPSQVFIHKRLK